MRVSALSCKVEMKASDTLAGGVNEEDCEHMLTGNPIDSSCWDFFRVLSKLGEVGYGLGVLAGWAEADPSTQGPGLDSVGSPLRRGNLRE